MFWLKGTFHWISNASVYNHSMLAAQQAAQQKGLPIPDLSPPKVEVGCDDVGDELHSTQQSAFAAFIEAFKQAQARKAAGQSDSLLPGSGTSLSHGRPDNTTTLPRTDIASAGNGNDHS